MEHFYGVVVVAFNTTRARNLRAPKHGGRNRMGGTTC